MSRIRQFEAAAEKLMSKGEIFGALHTTPGQEGAIVGACMALERSDYMVGTHRSHGHPIGKGASLDRLMAELLGRITGVNQGKGGSMHLADFSVGSLGETSIVGSGLPVATGAALGCKMQKNGRVALCFFGDGAASEGTFHESLNLAAIWTLPVVYFCENNGYAISTAARDAIAVQDIASRAKAYAMPGHIVDGQDVLAVYEITRRAVDRARAGKGPSLIEAKTYRFSEHAAGLPPLKYRSDDEIASWRLRDPIALLAQEWTGNAASTIDAEVAQEVEAAVQFALTSARPVAADAFDHVFSDPLSSWAFQSHEGP